MPIPRVFLMTYCNLSSFSQFCRGHIPALGLHLMLGLRAQCTGNQWSGGIASFEMRIP